LNGILCGRIKVSTTTTGTADFGLGSATSTAFVDFDDGGIPNGATVHYAAYTATEFECGEGVYDSGVPELSRDTIFQSSNAGLIVTFGSSPTVIVTPLAESVVLQKAPEIDETLVPDANDGAALGTTALRLSDLFLADGAVIDFGAAGSKVTVTHSAASDSITIDADPDNATANSQINFDVDGGRTCSINATGIAFNADTAAANSLDDYEEGTWSPTYSPASGTFTTLTLDGATGGTYTKVGRTVSITGRIRTDVVTVGTAAGALSITGLPFAITGADASAPLSFVLSWAGDFPLVGYVESSFIGLLYRTSVNGSIAATDVSDMTTGSSADSNDIIFSAVYNTV
jgi:hypothetical protein